MKNKLVLSILFLFFLFVSCKDKIVKIETINIIPLPEKIKLLNGHFLLDVNCKITHQDENEDLNQLKEYFEDYLAECCQLDLQEDANSKNNSIQLILNPKIKYDEAYDLSIAGSGIIIEGKTAKGIFYGIQSLIQLLPPQQDEVDGFQLPFCKISDKPAFEWRGLHLDVCRHFFSIKFIKKLIDLSAKLKLNIFHWHLTEDQGWRIEIKKYPKLTEIGAWRKHTLVGSILEHPHKYDGKKHGGFYTQEQIKEVVEYAKNRFVTIVPEIEMPGHALAALASYPEYSCTGGPFEVLAKWGVSDEVYCAGKDATFNFIEDILSEVIELFPGEYIHIGGDECPKVRWEKCIDCQKRIKDERLKNEHELQSYFIKRIEKYLNSKGKKLIGWDEILEGGLAEGATVMSWRGEMGGIESAMSGHDVVMSPNATNYFDHYQGKYNEPLAIGGYTPMREVYDYQPIPNELEPKYHKHILGSQANVWTEYIPTEKHAEYMIFPRLCALAENLWTIEERQNWDDFLSRMDTFYPVLDFWNVNYRINMPEGYNDINRTTDENLVIELNNGIASSEIRYTIDGSEPNPESPLYTEPFDLKLDKDIKVKAATFLKNNRKSAVMTALFEKMKAFEGLKTKSYGTGVSYLYYEGEFSTAKNFNVPEIYNGVTNNFRLPADHTENFFGVAYTGYFKVPSDGVYTFYLESSDGSVLYIHDKPIVDNDGFKSTEERSGKVMLKKGLHPFKLNYFQAKYSSHLKVFVEGTEIEKQTIPDSWLWK